MLIAPEPRAKGQWLGSLLLHYRQQLHFKDQRLVGTNVTSSAAVSIGQIRRHKKLPLRSYRHELERLCPPLNYAIHREGRRTAVFARAVKFLPINERTLVVANDLIRRCGLRSRPLRENFVLQSAGQRNHSFFCLVGCQKGVALLLIFIGLKLSLLFLLRAHIIL